MDKSLEIQFNTEVTNVLFEFEGNKKIAKAIECKVNGVEKRSSHVSTDSHS